MKFTLQIDCDNDAFAIDTDNEEATLATAQEIARILTATARDIVQGAIMVDDVFTLRDANGNTVGRATLKG